MPNITRAYGHISCQTLAAGGCCCERHEPCPDNGYDWPDIAFGAGASDGSGDAPASEMNPPPLDTVVSSRGAGAAATTTGSVLGSGTVFSGTLGGTSAIVGEVGTGVPHVVGGSGDSDGELATTLWRGFADAAATLSRVTWVHEGSSLSAAARTVGDSLFGGSRNNT